MNFQRKEVIKNYILDERLTPEERGERFEVAWDIWNYFDDILRELALNNFIQPLKRKLEEVLPSSFEVSKFYVRNITKTKEIIGIYITKPEWRLGPEDRGVVAVAFERWNNGSTVGLVKNGQFLLGEIEET